MVKGLKSLSSEWGRPTWECVWNLYSFKLKGLFRQQPYTLLEWESDVFMTDDTRPHQMSTYPSKYPFMDL